MISVLFSYWYRNFGISVYLFFLFFFFLGVRQDFMASFDFQRANRELMEKEGKKLNIPFELRRSSRLTKGIGPLRYGSFGNYKGIRFA